MKCISKAMLLCLVLAISQTAAAEQSIRITNGEWQPYMSERVLEYGIASHIVAEAFALAGVRVEYGFYPWKRAFDLAKKGRWDGSVGWSHSEERAQSFYFSDPVFSSDFAFFHRKDSTFDWNTMDDLKDTWIGATREYNYGDDFAAAEKAGVIRPEYVATDELNLRKLHKGRIDVFPGEVMVTYAQIRDNFSEQDAAAFTHHSKLIRTNTSHLILSKASPDNEHMVELFNKGLKKLKESGRYDEIIADGLAGKYSK